MTKILKRWLAVFLLVMMLPIKSLANPSCDDVLNSCLKNVALKKVIIQTQSEEILALQHSLALASKPEAPGIVVFLVGALLGTLVVTAVHK